jgi:hypothetical protein
MKDKTRTIHEPEKRNGNQDVNAHGQSGQKPDLLLMFG